VLALFVFSTISYSTTEAKGQVLKLKLKDVMDVVEEKGRFTYLPKRSVLHIPKGMEAKFHKSKGSKYLRFDDFYKKNQLCIHKFEVSKSEIEGESKISEERLDRLRKIGKIIIAVNNGQPTSIISKKIKIDLTDIRK
jgi:uncharacterized protein